MNTRAMTTNLTDQLSPEGLLAFWAVTRDGLVLLAVTVLVLSTGWLVATAASGLLRLVLRRIRFNDGLRRLLGPEAMGTHEPAALASWALHWILLLTSAVVACDVLGLGLGAALVARFRDILPRVLASGILLAAGALLAMTMGALTRRFFDSAGLGGGRWRGQVVTTVFTFFAVLLAVEQLGFAIQFVMGIGLILAGAGGLALALAFGIGCRDLARDFLVEYLRALDEQPRPRR